MIGVVLYSTYICTGSPHVYIEEALTRDNIAL